LSVYDICASTNYIDNDMEMSFCIKSDVCEDPLVIWTSNGYRIMQKLLFCIIMQTCWANYASRVALIWRSLGE